MALQTYKVGDLVKWDNEQFNVDGTVRQDVLFGVVLERKKSVSAYDAECYRVMLHENNETYDIWLYPNEIKKVSKSLNKV